MDLVAFAERPCSCGEGALGTRGDGTGAGEGVGGVGDGCCRSEPAGAQARRLDVFGKRYGFLFFIRLLSLLFFLLFLLFLFTRVVVKRCAVVLCFFFRGRQRWQRLIVVST